MATDTLNTVREAANSEPSLYDLATNVQVQTNRIKSLAKAIDDALNYVGQGEEGVLAQGRAIDFLSLLEDAAENARASGEHLELVAIGARKAASR
jgi:hypothetical protein